MDNSIEIAAIMRESPTTQETGNSVNNMNPLFRRSPINALSATFYTTYEYIFLYV
jgi:hypothetical protein